MRCEAGGSKIKGMEGTKVEQIMKMPSESEAGYDPLDATADILIDVVDERGAIVDMNRQQRIVLGIDAPTVGFDLTDLYDRDSAKAVRALFERAVPDGYRTTIELVLMGRGGRAVPVLAVCTSLTVSGRAAFRLTKSPLGQLAGRLEDGEANGKLLRDIIDTAAEGHWCIEFLEPVDTRRDRAQIIDEIFENASVWRVANPAMARLYDLPAGHLMRAEDVRLYWPRSRENESFVGQIIDAGYIIDRAQSLDKRHDGTAVRLENDVRAEIVDGYLRRIWGNCRDVTNRGGGP